MIARPAKLDLYAFFFLSLSLSPRVRKSSNEAASTSFPRSSRSFFLLLLFLFLTRADIIGCLEGFWECKDGEIDSLDGAG